MATPKQPSKPKRTKGWDAAKDEQHRIRRQLILEAAAQCLNERGFEGTSLSRIAKQLNMTNGALYYYFESKTDLAQACLMATQEQIAACLDEAEAHDGNGLTKVEAFVVAMVEANSEQPGWVLSGAPYFLTAEQARELHGATSRSVERLAGLIGEGISDGSIRPSDPLGTALLILSSLNFQTAASPFAAAVSTADMKQLAKHYVSHSLARLV